MLAIDKKLDVDAQMVKKKKIQEFGVGEEGPSQTQPTPMESRNTSDEKETELTQPPPNATPEKGFTNSWLK